MKENSITINILGKGFTLALNYANEAKSSTSKTEKGMSDITENKSFGGLAFFDEGNFFMFSPDERIVGATPCFRAYGVAQQMSGGTFDFVPTRRRNGMMGINRVPRRRRIRPSRGWRFSA